MTKFALPLHNSALRYVMNVLQWMKQEGGLLHS